MKECTWCGERKDLTEFQQEGKPIGDMCHDCLIILARANAKLDKRLGNGNIRTKMNDGRLVDMDVAQEWMFMVREGTPEVDWANEGEVDRNGEPLSFTDVDLMRLSYYRVRSVFTRKGFKEMNHQDYEDAAAAVIVDFLEKLNGTDPIENLNGYHWALVKAQASKKMEEWVGMRLSTIPVDVLDYADAHDIPDLSLSNYGERELLDTREKKQARWTALEVDNLQVFFGERGVYLTPREFSALRRALKGENRGLKSKPQVRGHIRSALSKIELADAGAYTSLMSLLK